MNDVYIPEPPKSACGKVKTGKTYIRGLRGGGWGGGSNGTQLILIAIWPPAGDDSGQVTKTSRRTTLRLVNFDAVLAYAPEEDWLVGNSRENWLNKQWDLHEKAVFGMSAKERLDNGVLDGIETVAEAQKYLLALRPSREAWEGVGRAIDQLSRLTINEEKIHPLVLQAHDGYRRGKPFLVLARLHEALRIRRTSTAVRVRIGYIFERFAPEDLFWMQMEGVIPA